MRLARSFIADPNVILQLEKTVKLRQAILQYFINNLELWREGQLAYLNSLWQFGVLKVGYSADMEDNEKAGEPMLDKEGKLLLDETGVPLVEPKYKVKREEFFIDQVDPECFLVDRYCRNDLTKTGHWVAEKIFRSIEDVQNDPFYDSEKVKDLEPSALEEAERLYLKKEEGFKTPWNWSTGATLPENEIVVIYEIYDLKRGETLSIIRGAKDIVRGPEPIPEGVDKHPFVVLKFNERRSSFYPIPTIFNWLGPQLEYNLTRNQTAIHRKRFNRKYGYLEGRIDPDEVEKLRDPYDGLYVKFNHEGAIEPIKDAPLDPAVYFDTRQLREEFMEISSVGQLQRSVVGAESATEAEIVERRAREGEIDEHEEMMDFLSKVVKKLHSSMEANLTQEGAIELIGPAGRKWISFGPEHFEKIYGEVIFTVEAEEASRITLQVERAQLLQLLDILGKNPMLAVDDVLLRAVFEKFPALANNELLVERVRNLAITFLRLQLAQGGQAASRKGAPTTTGRVAQESRKVATGR